MNELERKILEYAYVMEILKLPVIMLKRFEKQLEELSKYQAMWDI